MLEQTVQKGPGRGLGLFIYSSTTPDTKKGGFEKRKICDSSPKLSIFNLTRKQRKRNEENPVQVLVYIIYFCKKQNTGKITEQNRAESVLIDRYAMRYILIFFVTTLDFFVKI